jgi:hypothetical protein
MPFYNSQAIIKTADNVAANYATNTWHFEADDVTALGSAHAALVTFYQAVDTYFSNLVNVGAGGLEIVGYAFADAPPRAPVLRTLATLTVGSVNPLPTEVSLCMSFQGTRQSGTPQARRRGRVYLPFMAEDNNATDARPSTTIINGVVAAGAALLAASDSAGTWSWLTYSGVAPGWSTVVDGWVDNEWDTQRRRGRRSTSRTTFT